MIRRRELLINMGGRDLSIEAAIIGRTLQGSYSNSAVVNVGARGLSSMPLLTEVYLPNCTTLEDSAFRYDPLLTSIIIPMVNSAGRTGNNYVFANCTSLETIVLPSVSEVCLYLGFYLDTALKTVDIGNHTGGFSNQTFYQCTSLKTLILRSSSAIWSANSANIFNGSSIASGGSGCDIYIPSSLYTHLGDGSALDYKSASNWSTFDGYGTITWKQIEGSIYENSYADGTPI